LIFEAPGAYGVLDPAHEPDHLCELAVTDSEKGTCGGSTWLIKAANHNPSVYMPPYEIFLRRPPDD
jgi:hypothetical protein